MSEQTAKLCECGCGLAAPIASRTHNRHGHIKGQPIRFIRGHGARRRWQDRFWAKVNKSQTCWNWTASLRKGYAGFDGKLAARFLWEMSFGPIPAGVLVLHKCDNPKCVRLEHLFLGTPKENTVDAANKGRMARGADHYCATLTPNLVRAIRRLYKPRTFSMNDVATKLGVSKWAVYDVLRGKSWRWLNRSDAR